MRHSGLGDRDGTFAAINTLSAGAAKEATMRKHSALLVAAILRVSSGIASAQSQTPMTKDRAPATSGQSAPQSDPARGTGVTGAPSSTNPQAGGGGAGYQTPREVPEAGGAPNTQTPSPKR
jgi:hypothetical protein